MVRQIAYAIIYLFLLQGLALSQSSYNTTFLSRWLANEGPVTSVDTRGDTVYFSSGFNLKIADFTNPSNPILLNKIAYLSNVTKVRLYDKYVIIQRHNYGIKVLDVEDPMNIEEVYDLPDPFIKNFEIKDDGDTVYLYLIYSNFFKTLIVTDPQFPQQIVNYPLNVNVADLAIAGDILAIIYSSWVKLIDISNPALPDPTGEYEFIYDEPYARYLIIDNNYIYTTFQFTVSGPGGFHTWDELNILDISNPSSPILVSSFPDVIWRNGISVFDRAYIVNENFEIYDLSNPVQPQLLHTFITSGTASDITIQGNNAFIADGVNGVLEVDITDAPELIGQYSFEVEECEIIEVKEVNSYAFLIDGWYYGANKFRAIDVSDPNNPIQVGEMPLISTDFKYAFDVAANGYAYFLTIVGNNVVRLHTIDVQDPNNLEEVAYIDFAGTDISDLYVYGNHLYACIVTSFVIFDISDPLNPVVCGTVTPDKGSRLIDIKDDLAFVSSRLYNSWNSKFYIYDLSDPCDPNELSSVEIPNTSDRVIDLSAGSGLLNIIRSSRGYVYDVSDPNNPVFLQTIEKTNFHHQFFDVNVYRDYLYLTESTYGIRIFDIGDAQNIEEVAYHRNLGALSTDAFSNKFYVASRELGLEIVKNDLITAVEKEKALPTQFTLSQNYPNPFNPSTKINYQLPEISFVALKIYDVLGNEIATLVNEEKPVGEYEVEFDGKGLPSGIYLYRLQAGNYSEVRKMVLLK